MDKQIVFEKVKTARLQRFLNNCYSMDVIEKCTNLWSLGDEFVLSYEDHGVQRLTYFTKSQDSLNELLKQIDSGHWYLEFMTKNPEEFIPAGFSLKAKLMRLANPDCRSVFEKDSPVLQYRDSAIVESAQTKDAAEINRILWDTFQTEISHLLTDEEVTDNIRQFTIHRENSMIDAVLQADVMPKKYYINQIVNRGEKKNIHAMLLNGLEEYIAQGGKYLYAWVEDKNIASQKFHQKYGMIHDGMWNMLYSLEKP